MPKQNDIVPILPPDPLLEEISKEQRVRHSKNSNRFPNKNKPPQISKEKSKAAGISQGFINLPLLAAGLASVLVVCIVVLVAVVNSYLSGLNTVRREAEALEAIMEEHIIQEMYERYGIYAMPEYVFEPGPFQSPFDAEMRQINPDFVCWITVEGTNINYPVVRGSDNETYLYRSFFGEPTQFGVPFMDYRNVGSFVPHIIIYGHNTRHNNLFSGLHSFLNRGFFEENRTISIKVNGRVVEYEIFSARLTDINDPAYFLNFTYPGAFEAFLERNSAPADAVQIITLSTCVRSPNDNDRLVVQGVLRMGGSDDGA